MIADISGPRADYNKQILFFNVTGKDQEIIPVIKNRKLYTRSFIYLVVGLDWGQRTFGAAIVNVTIQWFPNSRYAFNKCGKGNFLRVRSSRLIFNVFLVNNTAIHLDTNAPIVMIPATFIDN